MSSVKFLRSSTAARSLSVKAFQGLGISVAGGSRNYTQFRSFSAHFSKGRYRHSCVSSKPSGVKTLNRIKSAVYFGVRWIALAATDVMHSEKHIIEFPNLKVIGIPATQDNFMYLVIEKSSQQAIVVDPVDPQAVLSEIRRENVTLNAILTTHHHWDHAGGNPELVSQYSNECPSTKLEVYGGDDRVDALTKKVGQGDVITLGSLEFHCLHTPCHTSGHICYFLKSQDPSQKPVVFTGDTLFIAGCGRFFEGTPEQMYSALIEKLGQLPPETLVCCGHEYTVGNLKFALSVEPNNKKMLDKLSWAEEQRKQRLPTFPSTIAEEKDINPFMRCVLGDMQKTVAAKSAIDCMGKLRNMKDHFKAK